MRVTLVCFIDSMEAVRSALTDIHAHNASLRLLLSQGPPDAVRQPDGTFVRSCRLGGQTWSRGNDIDQVLLLKIFGHFWLVSCLRVPPTPWPSPGSNSVLQWVPSLSDRQ
jgi:hypothetical protein